MLDDAATTMSAPLLECHPMPAVIVDGEGMIALANAGARQTLRHADGLAMVRGQLRCACQQANPVLNRLLRCEPGVSIELRAMRVPRTATEGTWLLAVKPLDIATMQELPRLVTWVDPDEPLPLKRGLLEALFGLSASEGRLATHLANGVDLRAAASLLGIQPDTAKSHLKAIFRKIGVHRQQQLVRTATLLRLFC